MLCRQNKPSDISAQKYVQVNLQWGYINPSQPKSPEHNLTWSDQTLPEHTDGTLYIHNWNKTKNK
jgi:hypothetical protein